MSGRMLVLITLVLWGAIPILDKKGLSGEHVAPLSGLFIRIVAALAAFLVFSCFHREVFRGVAAVSWRAMAFFAASGICSALLAQYSYYEALKDQNVSRLFPVLFGGTPVVTAILGVVVLGEVLTASAVVGLGFIVLGSVLLMR